MIRAAVVASGAASGRAFRALAGIDGVVVVGSAEEELAVWPMLRRARPDVVVVEHQIASPERLVWARRVKRQPPPTPRVVVYSLSASPLVGVAGFLARADEVVFAAAPAQDLAASLGASKDDSVGQPAITRVALATSSQVLPEEDRPIVPMLLGGASERVVAQTLGVTLEELEARIEATIARLGGSSSVERR